MKLKLIALALGAGLGLSTAAQAQWTGGYVEAGVGVRAATTKMTTTTSFSDDGFAFSDKATANVGERGLLGSLGAGWRFEAGNVVLGVGAFWNPASEDAGKQKDVGTFTFDGETSVATTTQKLKQKDHWGLGVEAGWKLAAPTMIYAKLAAHRAKFDASLISTTDGEVDFSERVRENHNGWGFGLGLRHMIDKNAYFFAEWQQVEFQSEKHTVTIDDLPIAVKIQPRNTLGLIGAGYRF